MQAFTFGRVCLLKPSLFHVCRRVVWRWTTPYAHKVTMPCYNVVKIVINIGLGLGCMCFLQHHMAKLCALIITLMILTLQIYGVGKLNYL